MQTQNLFALSLFKLQEHCLTAKTDRQETELCRAHFCFNTSKAEAAIII